MQGPVLQPQDCRWGKYMNGLRWGVGVVKAKNLRRQVQEEKTTEEMILTNVNTGPAPSADN